MAGLKHFYASFRPNLNESKLLLIWKHLIKDEVKQTLKKHDTFWSLIIWVLSNVWHSPDEHIIKTNSNTLAIRNNSVSQSVGKSLLCSDRSSSQNQVEGSWQTNETRESHCASVNQGDTWKKDAPCKTCFCATRSTKGDFCLALHYLFIWQGLSWTRVSYKLIFSCSPWENMLTRQENISCYISDHCIYTCSHQKSHTEPFHCYLNSQSVFYHFQQEIHSQIFSC